MNLYFLGNMLNYASLLMIAGTGACFALKNGQMNLGGEGQIYAGGFTAAIVMTRLSEVLLPRAMELWLGTFIPSVIIITAGALSAALAGFLMSGLSALLRYKKDAAELLTSYLLSAAAIPVLDGAISGRFRTTEGNLLATAFIDQCLRFTKWLRPSFLNITFAWGIFICAAGAWVLYRSAFGKRIYLFGNTREFALGSGLNEFECTWQPFCLSGILHGLTGFFAVAGTYYTCHSGFYAGMGWNALSIALIARRNPLLLLPVAILYSLLYSTATQIVLMGTTGFDISTLIQGLVLLSIAFIHFKKGEKKQ